MNFEGAGHTAAYAWTGMQAEAAKLTRACRLNDDETEELDRALMTALDLREYACGQPVGPVAFGSQPRA